jgi:hypothetical protein
VLQLISLREDSRWCVEAANRRQWREGRLLGALEQVEEFTHWKGIRGGVLVALTDEAGWEWRGVPGARGVRREREREGVRWCSTWRGRDLAGDTGSGTLGATTCGRRTPCRSWGGARLGGRPVRGFGEVGHGVGGWWAGWLGPGLVEKGFFFQKRHQHWFDSKVVFLSSKILK